MICTGCTLTWSVLLRHQVRVPGLGEVVGQERLAVLQAKVLGVGTGHCRAGGGGRDGGGGGGEGEVWEGGGGSCEEGR